MNLKKITQLILLVGIVTKAIQASDTNSLTNHLSLDDKDILTMAIGNAKNKSKQLNPTDPNYQTFGDLYNINSYLENNYKHSSTLTTITENLEPVDMIINARGDGNCGYRAFYGSIFMNAIKSDNHTAVKHIKKLLMNNYVTLFKNYNKLEDFKGDVQVRVPDIILQYLLDTIDYIDNECKDITAVRNILNQEVAFDYYIIMFLRYLLVNNIDDDFKNSHPDDFNIITNEATSIGKTLDEYSNAILQWADELTLGQSHILTIVTNISIFTLSQNDRFQQLAICKADNASGSAYILYVPGHYRIFIPKSYEHNYLIDYFEKLTELKKQIKPDNNNNKKIEASPAWWDFNSYSEQTQGNIGLAAGIVTGVAIAATIGIIPSNQKILDFIQHFNQPSTDEESDDTKVSTEIVLN